MKIVNGFVCECGGDEKLAKKGVDPDNPHNDPVKARELEERRGIPSDEPVEETQSGVFDPKRTDGAVGFDANALAFGGGLAGQDVSGSASAEDRLVDRLV